MSEKESRIPPFARVEEINDRTFDVLIGESLIVFYSSSQREKAEDWAKAYNHAFHARCAPLLACLGRIQQRTLTDAEGPELRAQNERNFADATAALEAFHGI